MLNEVISLKDDFLEIKLSLDLKNLLYDWVWIKFFVCVKLLIIFMVLFDFCLIKNIVYFIFKRLNIIKNMILLLSLGVGCNRS